MTSLQDVADQINAKLDEIITNTAANVTRTGQVRDEVVNLRNQVAALDAHLQTGLANLADGLFAVWEVGKASLVELRHHSDQNDTLICLVQHTNDLLCGITRKLTTEIAITRDIDQAVRRIEGITERTEPGAAGDYDRLRQLGDRLTECCPPEPVPPEPCPEPCPTRQYEPYPPKGQDWTPLDRPNPEG